MLLAAKQSAQQQQSCLPPVASGANAFLANVAGDNDIVIVRIELLAIDIHPVIALRHDILGIGCQVRALGLNFPRILLAN